MSAALTAVVGSSSGAALRKAIRDVDAADLAARLVSRSGRDVRRRAALSVAGAMEKALLPRRRKVSHVEEESVVSLNAQSAKGLRRASSPASRDVCATGKAVAAARRRSSHQVARRAAGAIGAAGVVCPREAVLFRSADTGRRRAAVPLGGFIARHGADHAGIPSATCCRLSLVCSNLL